jgi:transcriptional regulatory protein RtcR
VDADSERLEALLPPKQLADIDEFDRLQLKEVVRVCRSCASLSDAGRRLFGVSRTRKAAANDADRLRKYLGRFGLDWKTIKAESQPTS